MRFASTYLITSVLSGFDTTQNHQHYHRQGFLRLYYLHCERRNLGRAVPELSLAAGTV